MISHNPFFMIKVYTIPVLYYCTLLIWRNILKPAFCFFWKFWLRSRELYLFLCDRWLVCVIKIRVIVSVLRFKYIFGMIDIEVFVHLLQDKISVFFLLLFLLNDDFWSNHKVVKTIVDISE